MRGRAAEIALVAGLVFVVSAFEQVHRDSFHDQFHRRG